MNRRHEDFQYTYLHRPPENLETRDMSLGPLGESLLIQSESPGELVTWITGSSQMGRGDRTAQVLFAGVSGKVCRDKQSLSCLR